MKKGSVIRTGKIESIHSFYQFQRSIKKLINRVKSNRSLLSILKTGRHLIIIKVTKSCITYKNDFTTSKSISPFRLSKYFFKSWSQCSNTNVNFLSLWRTSFNLTIFLCFNSLSKQISLSAEDGTPWKKIVEKKSKLNIIQCLMHALWYVKKNKITNMYLIIRKVR